MLSTIIAKVGNSSEQEVTRQLKGAEQSFSSAKAFIEQLF